MDTSNPVDLDKTFCSTIENWNTDEELLKSKLRSTTRKNSVQSTIDSQKLLKISELVIGHKYGRKELSIDKLKTFYDEIQNLTINGKGIQCRQKKNASQHLKYIQNVIKCNAEFKNEKQDLLPSSNSVLTQTDEGFLSLDLCTQTTQNAFISETPNRDITQQSVLLPKSMTEIVEVSLSGKQTVRKRNRITKNRWPSKKSKLVNSIIKNVIKFEPADTVDEPNPEIQIVKTSQDFVKQSKNQTNITNNPTIQYSNSNAIILSESKMEKEPLYLQESMPKDVKRPLRERKRTVNQSILSPPKDLLLVKCAAKTNDTIHLNTNNLNQTQENMPMTGIVNSITVSSYPEQFSTKSLNVQSADTVEPNLNPKIVDNTKVQSSATNFKRNKKSHKSQVDIVALSQPKRKAKPKRKVKPKSKANPKKLEQPNKCPLCTMKKNENQNPKVTPMPKKANAKRGRPKKEEQNLPVLSSIENLQFEKCTPNILYPKNLNQRQEIWPKIDKVTPLYNDNNSKTEAGSFLRYSQQFPTKYRNVEQPNYPTHTSSLSTFANLPLSISDYGTQHPNNIDNNGNVKRHINNIDKVIFKSCALIKSIIKDENQEHLELEFQNCPDEELLVAEKEVNYNNFLYLQDTNLSSSSIPVEIDKSIEHSYKPEDVLKSFKIESKNLTEDIADSIPKYHLTNKHVTSIADILNINSEDLHFLIRLILENDAGEKIVDLQSNSNLQAPSDTDSVVSASQSPINRRYGNCAVKL